MVACWFLAGVHGVQGDAECLLADPGAHPGFVNCVSTVNGESALRVNCVHPGFVKTDMTVNFGMLTPEEGGSRVVAVALLPAGWPTGAYFEERQQAPFV